MHCHYFCQRQRPAFLRFSNSDCGSDRYHHLSEHGTLFRLAVLNFLQFTHIGIRYVGFTCLAQQKEKDDKILIIFSRAVVSSPFLRTFRGTHEDPHKQSLDDLWFRIGSFPIIRCSRFVNLCSLSLALSLFYFLPRAHHLLTKSYPWYFSNGGYSFVNSFAVMGHLEPSEIVVSGHTSWFSG